MNHASFFQKMIAALLIGGVALRIFCTFVFSSLEGDSAVAALMAKHIAEGRDFPIYFWLCHYGGTLSSYMAAVLFKLLGTSTSVFHLTGLLYSSLWLFLVYVCARRILDPAGVVAALLVAAFPPYGIMMSSLFAGGIRAETLVFGSLIFQLLIRLKGSIPSEQGRWYGWLGFFLGFGLWVTPSMAPWFIIVTAVLFFQKGERSRAKKFVPFIVSLLAGFSPGILYEIRHPLAQLFRFAGRVACLDRSALDAGSWSSVLIGGVVRRLSLVVPSFLKIPALFVQLAGLLSLVLLGVALTWLIRERPWRKATDVSLDPWFILVFFICVFTIFHVFLVGDPKPRYMLSYYVVLPFLAGKLLSECRMRSVWVWRILFVGTIVANLSTYGRAFYQRDNGRYEALVLFLQDRRIDRFYSDYWTAYPVIFESGERIIASPTLLHPTFSDRRPEYTALTRAASAASFVVDTRLYPNLARDIEENLRGRGVAYRKESVRDFVVYSDLSRKVFPEELSLKIL